MPKRYRQIATILFVFFFTLAACDSESRTQLSEETTAATNTPAPTQTPGPSPTATESILRGTVTIWHSWEESEISLLAQVIQDFQDEYPDIHFDVLYVPLSSLRERFEVETREGGGPLLLFGPADWGPGLYDAGYLADLSGLVGDISVERLNPAAVASGDYRDVMIGLPYTIRGIVLYRNSEIIAQPADDFDALVSSANLATRGGAVGAMLDRSFFYSGAHLNGIGGRLMDEAGNPAFNDQQGIEWVRLLQSFDQAGPTDFFTDQDVELFRLGSVGFIVAGSWRMNFLAESIGADNLSIDPWPAYEGGMLAGYIQSENLFLNSRSSEQNRMAAGKFIEYFLSPNVQAQLPEVGFTPSAADDETIALLTDPLMIQAVTALGGGDSYPVLPEIVVYTAQMDIALQSVFNEDVPAEQALESAESAILSELQEVRTTPAP